MSQQYQEVVYVYEQQLLLQVYSRTPHLLV